MTVIFIDGRNCLYRFGYAMKNLATEDGTKTGAIHGLLSCLLRLKARYEHARFVVVWDGKHYRANWRSKIWDGYKANRNKAQSPEVQEVLMQFGAIRRAFDLLGIVQASLDEVECDDLIGVLSAKCLELEWEPVIYSSDKDFLQLMASGVKVIRDVKKPSKLKPEDAMSVLELYQCPVKDVLKVRAICGDGSDGIPGVEKGVGAVRASELVAKVSWERICRSNPLVTRNYRLMKIICAVDDPELPTEHKLALTQELGRVTGLLKGTIKAARGSRDRMTFLSLLAELELNELLGRRDELWSLGLYG